jgi:lon-related putative ATP-dependent protease
MSVHLKLNPSALKLEAALTAKDFKKQSAKQQGILGQQRAQEALKFGVAMKNPGYNIFVMGQPSTGRLSMITSALNERARQQSSPPSYAYVGNFTKPREPITIELPSGHGEIFSKDIETLIDNLLATFPAAFESPMYQQKKSAIERSFNQRYSRAIDKVDKKSRTLNVALYREGDGITFLPIRKDKLLEDDEFALLPQPDREAFHQHVAELEEYLSETLLELPQWRRAMVEEIKQLDNETIDYAIAPLLDELNKKYQNIDDVISFLAEIKTNLTHTITDYLMPSRTLEENDLTTRRLILTEQYMPNIIVDYPKDTGAPVVYESHPTYQNLFGRIEYVSDQGTLVTTYRRICAGSLHRANGGYLILDAEEVLTYPFVWEGLKRALQSGLIEIETPYSEFGINTITLKPEVIPLNIKIILFGSRQMYYLLEEMDSEFNEMFRVLADFDDNIVLNDESMQQFAALMQNHTNNLGMKPLSHKALERLIEYSCRLSENQQRLSAHVKDCLEIISETNFLSEKDGDSVISREQIQQALNAREARHSRISEEILEEMLEGTILIDTSGDAIGKINGLTVLEIGGSSFGAPARITTTVHSGSRGIVDIEREAELGQAIHSKGVLILTGYLGHCYAQQFSLAISASIAMEQSYGYIDGDSASLAELCCLISALTRTPIKQSFAVTGSINQYGEVQAIGGVNEKIEGFFRLCDARGLTGEQGVIIPASNKRNLMLKQEVIDAVEKNLFSIYVVHNVNETLELLMGGVAGCVDEKGVYPEGSINFKAISRLKEISEINDDDDKEE